jgi:hypothetical protein
VRADCVPIITAGTQVKFSVVTLRNFSSGCKHYAGYETGMLTLFNPELSGLLADVDSPDMLLSDRTFLLPSPQGTPGELLATRSNALALI